MKKKFIDILGKGIKKTNLKFKIFWTALTTLCIASVSIAAMLSSLFTNNELYVYAGDVIEGKYGNLTYHLMGGEIYIFKCDILANGTLTIPAMIDGVAVTTVERYAFSGCNGLTEVIVPASVSEIGYRAFDGCTSLEKVTVLNRGCSIAVSGYDDDAVNNYSNNGEYTFPENAVLEGYTESAVQKYAKFYARTFLDIETGEKIKYTEDDYEYVVDLSGCKTIDEDIMSLFELLYGYGASKIIIDSECTKIEPSAFKNFTKLREIAFTDESSNYKVFDGALYNFDMTELLYYPNAKKMAKLPESVTNINPDALLYSEWYQNQPDGLVYVGNMLYKYKGEIPANSNIVVKEGTTSILSEVFDDCANIKSIAIPTTVSSIAENALKSNYKSMTIIGESYSIAEQYAQKKALSFMDSESKEILPFENMSYFQYSINKDDTISVYFVHSGYSKTDIEIPKRIDGLPVVDISAVGDDITSIILPDTLKTISDNAFKDCESLLSIKLPDGIESIGDNAFYRCTNLKEIIIPNSVTHIGAYAFRQCYSLESINLSENMPIIEMGTFENCFSLQSILIPDSVTQICDNAFCRCDLKSIKIPISVERIGESAFYGTNRIIIQNANCLIDGNILTGRNYTGTTDIFDGIIYGYADSTAQEFAEKNEYTFKIYDPTIRIHGDCNDDGILSIADAVLLQKWLLAVPGTKFVNWKAADLCEDDRLNVFDLCMMKRALIS